VSTSGGSGGGGGPSGTVVQNVTVYQDALPGFQSLYLAHQAVIPWDPASSALGTSFGVLTGVPMLYPASTDIAVFSAASVEFSAPIVLDAFDVAVTVYVTDTLGVNQMGIGGGGQIPIGASGLALSSADMTVVASAGADLSYNSGGGNIVTAAGGLYSVIVLWQFGWD
jgi:hypothetical protein